MVINFNPENPIGVLLWIVNQKDPLPPFFVRVGMTALSVISNEVRNLFVIIIIRFLACVWNDSIFKAL